MRDNSRKLMEITEVDRLENGRIMLNPLYRFEEDEYATASKVSGHLNRTANRMIHPEKFISSGIYHFLGEDYRKLYAN
jgi:pilus assembly protein CpaF